MTASLESSGTLADREDSGTNPGSRHDSAFARWADLTIPVRESEPEPFSPAGRFVVAALAIATGVVGLLARLFGAEGLGAGALSLYLTLGVGVAACLPFRRLTPAAFGMFSVTAGLAVTTAVGFLMAETALWYPVPAFVVVGLASLVSLVSSLVRDYRLLSDGGFSSLIRGLTAAGARTIVLGATLGGTALIVIGAGLAQSLPQEGGLLSAVGPVWYLGYVVIAVAFGYAVFAGVSIAAPVLAAGTAVILSQAIMYGAPTVMAAGRHLGLTEFLAVNGGVGVSTDIYQSWPGLFAGTAWVVDATGITNPLAYATWWPVLVTPAVIAGVAVLAGRILPSGRAWIAAAVFAVASSINSMYFAPQVAGLLLSLAVLAIVVVPPANESTRDRRSRLGIAFFLILVMVVTHQISPFMLGLALLALVLFRLAAPWWLPLMAFVPAIAWAAVNWTSLSRYVDLSAIGSLLSNIAPPEHPDPVAGLAPTTRLAFLIPGAALVVLGIIALVGVLRTRDRWSWGLTAAAVSPLGLAFATNYGQEGIFRVVLFATPWLAILVARCSAFQSTVAKTALSVGFVVMMAISVYGQTALDWARVVRVSDATAVAQFERTAPADALLLSVGTKNATPTRITENYDEVGYTSRERIGGFPAQVGDAYDANADVLNLTKNFAQQKASAHYALVSDSIGAYDDRYGLQRYDDYLKLKAAMASSDKWIPVYTADNVTLYRLASEPVG